MNNIDVANNIKAIEMLKAELMQSIANIFGDMISEPTPDIMGEIANDTANIITLAYLLSKRLGVPYKDINHAICNKLKVSIEENHNLEKKFGDLSSLLDIFEGGGKVGGSNDR